MVAGAFAGLLDLVLALDGGAGDLLTRFVDAVGALTGLFDLVFAFSTGAGDLLGWRVGCFAGLLDLEAALGPGAGAFAGLLLRARVTLTGEAWLPLLAALLTGLLDLEAARLEVSVTLLEATFSVEDPKICSALRGDEVLVAAFFLGEATLLEPLLVFTGERGADISRSRASPFVGLFEDCLLTAALAIDFATATTSSSSTAAPFFGDTDFLDGEVLLVTLPDATPDSKAASCAFVEGTTRLGEDLRVTRSGLADLVFALLDLEGDALRLAPARAGVPSVRVLAIGAGIINIC